jgi:hypothetical protein
MGRLRLDPFQTPTKKESNSSSSRQLLLLGDESPSPSPSSDPSPPNTIARELERILYPPTKDEQIVNTALIVLLNALTTHFDFYSNWTLHRKPFTATFENAQFEARTDGYLDSPGGKTRVIIEVKPVLRSRHLYPFRCRRAPKWSLGSEAMTTYPSVLIPRMHLSFLRSATTLLT